jgi:hypothetical protein
MSVNHMKYHGQNIRVYINMGKIYCARGSTLYILAFDSTINYYYFTGRVAEALIYYRRAMAVNMEHRESVLGLARVLRDRGQKSRVYRLITW